MSFSVTLPPEYCDDLKYIAEGSYGCVWTCTRRVPRSQDASAQDEGPSSAADNNSGAAQTSEAEPEYVEQSVAIKVLRDFDCTRRMMTEDKRRLSILRTFREVHMLLLFQKCEEFISILDMFTSRDGNDLYLVMPYVPHSLHTAIQSDVIQGKGFDEGTTGYVLMQILVALRRMARCGCVHRDLTCPNILIDPVAYNIYLADFGLARSFFEPNAKMTIDVVALAYRPPELLLRHELSDNSIDVWSAGMVALDMLIGRSPFLMSKDAIHQLNAILQHIAKPKSLEAASAYVSSSALQYLTKQWQVIEGFQPSVRTLLSQTYPREVSSELLDVLEAMLTFDPHERKTAEQLLGMPFFQNGPDAATMTEMMASTEPQHGLSASIETQSADDMVKELLEMCRKDSGSFRVVVTAYGGKFQDVQ